MSLAFEYLGTQAYRPMWEKLRQQASLLAVNKADEVIWSCEHEAIYTTGKRAIDNRLDIQLPAPLLVTDRGGETTFHGLGQTMLYPIIDLRQRGLNVRQYIMLLEQSAIAVLAEYGVESERRCGLPGVWTEHGKIVAIGIRVSQGVAYHGMALNRCVDLSYFKAINPCGTGLSAASMQKLCSDMPEARALAARWARCLETELSKY